MIDRAGRKTDFTYAPTKKLTSVTRYLSDGNTNLPVTISYNFDKMFNSLSITNPSTDAVETYLERPVPGGLRLPSKRRNEEDEGPFIAKPRV